MTAALEGGEWSAARPGRKLPPGNTRYPFYSRLGGPQGRSGRAEILVPTGIRSRAVQPVAQSLYRPSYPAHPKICSLQLFIPFTENIKNVPHTLPISFFSILSPAQYWVRSTDHLAPRYSYRNNRPKNCRPLWNPNFVTCSQETYTGSHPNAVEPI